jgi:hypothetical protein
MNRYKFTTEGIKSAIKFLKNESETGPNWAVRYKADLKVKGSDVFYKDKKIITKEQVGKVLRKEIYKVDADIPAARDSAFHLLKSKYTGITRRHLMKWLQAQKSIGETRPSVNKAKRSAGEKMKTYTFETDLIFLKRKDVVQADDKFEMKQLDVLPELMYIVSTIEKVTGLSRLTKCYKKEPAIVGPIVEKHIEEMCVLLKTKPKDCNLRSDKGLEFDHVRLAKLVGNTKFVPMGPHVENRNRQAQTQLFRCLRQRKSKTIAHALSQAEKLLNQTYNRIHKKTSNEIVKSSKEENLKQYNKKRPQYIEGDKRKPFAVGDHVRILIKEKKAGIAYKSYKNTTWSEKVYLVKRVTKKAVPPKFYVNGKWMLKDNLLRTQPRDEESMTLLLEREVKADVEEKKEEEKHQEKRKKEDEQFDKKKKKEVAAGRRRKTRGVSQSRQNIRDTVRVERQQDRNVVEAKRKEDEEFKKREKIKSVEHKRSEIEKKLEQKKKSSKTVEVDDWDKKVMFAWLKARNKPTFGAKADLKRRIQYYLKRGQKV